MKYILYLLVFISLLACEYITSKKGLDDEASVLNLSNLIKRANAEISYMTAENRRLI